MSDAKIDLPAGQIRFVDSYQPGVKAGTYEIKVKQTVSAAGVSVPDLAQRFLVAGPRFVVDRSEIHAEFPPNGASSQFATVLPHVVMNKRLLPWERQIPGLQESVPWLALLVFQDGELIGNEQDSATLIANYAQTMTVGKLLGNASAAVRTSAKRAEGITRRPRTSPLGWTRTPSSTWAPTCSSRGRKPRRRAKRASGSSTRWSAARSSTTPVARSGRYST